MARKFWLNGKWKSSGDLLSVTNPFNGSCIDDVYAAEDKHLDEIIGSNFDAFEQTREMPAWKRARILQNIAAGIGHRKTEFTETIVQEAGKPISYARGEVERAVLTFTLAAEEAKRIGGEVIPLDLNTASEGRFGVTRRFPVGPVIGISPFNFPLNLVAHKIGPAVAAGNTITIKPSSQTPLTALLLAEVISESGALPGQVNIIPMNNSLAEKLVRNPRFRILSFTGSDSVGWQLKGLDPRKKVTLELGGNAALIVDKDVDISAVAKRAVAGAFAYAGQVCISIQRIYAHIDIFEYFLTAFADATRQIGTGDPMKEETVVGPMIDTRAADRVETWLEEAREAGAQILCGGKRSGNMITPAVLTHTTPDMKVCCREAFAPLVVIEPFREFREAVALVNNSVYGLQAGIFSNQYEHILFAFRQIEVGGLIINDFPTYRVDNMPYGGVKASGFGREGLKYAVDEMTENRLMVFNTMGF